MAVVTAGDGRKTRGFYMEQGTIERLGDELYQALRTQVPVSPLTEREPGITLDDACYISLRMLQQPVARDGLATVRRWVRVASRARLPLRAVLQSGVCLHPLTLPG